MTSKVDFRFIQAVYEHESLCPTLTSVTRGLVEVESESSSSLLESVLESSCVLIRDGNLISSLLRVMDTGITSGSSL